MKLYVVVRRDPSPAQQAVQGMHAAIAIRSWSHQTLDWDGTIAFVSIEDERRLGHLAAAAFDRSVMHSTFREPDLGNSLTAVALFGAGAAALCRSLPLALA